MHPAIDLSVLEEGLRLQREKTKFRKITILAPFKISYKTILTL